MIWLHTWVGLIAGWLVFAIFATGTASYFRPEINQWMQLEHAPGKSTPAAVARAAAEYLRANAGDASRWLIDLPDARDPLVHAYAWRQGGGRPSFQQWKLDPATGEPAAARESEGGDFLYYFHFDLRVPRNWGYWTTCSAAIAMLVALVSGVIAHRRIFADFFTFRSRPAPRAWLDAHNVLGVLALPFHVMIAYTGVITLLFIYLPWGLQAAYPSDRQAFFAELLDAHPPPAAAGEAAPLAPIETIVNAASQLLAHDAVGRLWIYRPAQAGSVVEVERAGNSQVSEPLRRLRYDRHGTRLPGTASPGPAATVRGVLHGLHIAAFADPLLRWLFFLSGLMGTGVCATGLILWTQKRRRRSGASFGLSLVERLNVAVIAGLPIAIAAYFWANRLIPIGLDDRAAWEIRCMFGAWAISLAHTVVRPAYRLPAYRMWVEQLCMAAAAFASLPVLHALTTDRHLGVSLLLGDWVMAGFDLTMLALGLAFGGAAWALAQRAWSGSVHRPGARLPHATIKRPDPAA